MPASRDILSAGAAPNDAYARMMLAHPQSVGVMLSERLAAHLRALMRLVARLTPVEIEQTLLYISLSRARPAPATIIEAFAETVPGMGDERMTMPDVLKDWARSKEGLASIGNLETVIIEDLKARERAEGKAEALVQLLSRRFGPLEANVPAQVHAATPEALDGWFDRAVDAASIDAVFDHDEKH
jgi:hypothetical protein